jgi:Protein of unknown function (DUF1592)/Protein of unknown function (DUF1595)/Protein of unknown function (DUF1588)/Protein of unknown function (DUF1587)
MNHSSSLLGRNSSGPPRAWARSRPHALLAVAALSCGCTGVVGNPGGSVGDGPPLAASGGAGPVATSGGSTSVPGDSTSQAPASITDTALEATGNDGAISVATPTISRLSELQWANTVRDLLLLPDPGDLTLPTADAVLRFDNEADSLFVGQSLHDDLQAAAERLAAQVAGDDSAIARLVPTDAPADATGKATAFLQAFGRRAYRRPLTAAELQQYLTLFNQGLTLTTGLSAFAAGVRVTLELFLQSPNFLYRTGFGGAAVQGRARLSDYEIAANLSYALTNTMPSASLSAIADQGGFKTSDAITAQAKLLIPTAAGKTAVDRFYFQYFGLGQYDTLEKSTDFPQFTSATGPALDSEAQQFLQYVFGQNGSLRDIFTSPVSFVNSAVAGLYGLTGSFAADTWTQVNLDATQRPGLLTRLGFLAYYGHDGSVQDSIHRGVYINGRVLCKLMSPPPGVVIPALPDPATTTNETNRQVINGITGPGTCGASCHATFINPAGFAFENFTGLGTFHSVENGLPVDPTGTYPFTDGAKSFANPTEFNNALADSAQAHACYAAKWAANLFTRIPRAGDMKAAATVAESSLDDNLSSFDLIVRLVSDDAFVTRVEDQQ